MFGQATTDDLTDLDDGQEILYTISLPDETDVNNDIISVESPVAVAMLGKEVGEKFEVDAPMGKLKYEILKITRD